MDVEIARKRYIKCYIRKIKVIARSYNSKEKELTILSLVFNRNLTINA